MRDPPREEKPTSARSRSVLGAGAGMDEGGGWAWDSGADAHEGRGGCAANGAAMNC